MKKVYYTQEQLDEIKMHLSVIQDCINMGGLAPYQADVINRRLNQALDILKKGNTEYAIKVNI